VRHVIVVVASRVRLAGDVDELLATHHRISGRRRDARSLPCDGVVSEGSHTDRQSTPCVREMPSQTLTKSSSQG